MRSLFSFNLNIPKRHLTAASYLLRIASIQPAGLALIVRAT